jgi:hypothetical protein
MLLLLIILRSIIFFNLTVFWQEKDKKKPNVRVANRVKVWWTAQIAIYFTVNESATFAINILNLKKARKKIILFGFKTSEILSEISDDISWDEFLDLASIKK